MVDRAYTVAEIDALRQLCDTKWLYGTFFQHFPEPTPIYDANGNIIGYGGSIYCSRSYKPGEKDKGVEELVRTYMLAGITAEDIRAQK